MSLDIALFHLRRQVYCVRKLKTFHFQPLPVKCAHVMQSSFLSMMEIMILSNALRHVLLLSSFVSALCLGQIVHSL